MTTTALVNARVLTDDGFVSGLVVLLEGERIVALIDSDDTRVRAAAVHDCGGDCLVPGFIDCQVNGGGDVLFNDAPSVETVRRIGAAHRRFGTTGFLPTLISDEPTVMRAARSAVEDAVAARVPGVLGVHLEGPFLAPGRRGIHDAEKFRTPDPHDLAALAKFRAGKLLLTLAPERVARTTIEALVANGVILAAGHTAADYETTRRALAAGVRGFTHLYNAMTPLGSREPGVVGAALEDRASWCGLIVDGHHVHAAALRIAIAAKPRGKTFLVTDAMPPVGGATTGFVLNGAKIECRDGICLSAEGVLAGSALDMASAVRNTVALVGLPLEEAARMASTYPAAFLGLGATHGRIAAGYRADLVRLDAALGVRETWIGGVREAA